MLFSWLCSDVSSWLVFFFNFSDDNSEHLFICLCAICVFPWWIFFFKTIVQLLIGKNSLYILITNPLSARYMFCKFYNLWLIFWLSFEWMSFEKQFKNLIRSNVLLFYLLFIAFCVLDKLSLLNPGSQKFILYFLL